MDVLIKFVGNDKPMALADVDCVQVFNGAKVEKLIGESLKGLRVISCADYIFETPDKILSVNSSAIVWIVVD